MILKTRREGNAVSQKVNVEEVAVGGSPLLHEKRWQSILTSSRDLSIVVEECKSVENLIKRVLRERRLGGQSDGD